MDCEVAHARKKYSPLAAYVSTATCLPVPGTGRRSGTGYGRTARLKKRDGADVRRLEPRAVLRTRGSLRK